MVAIYDGNFRLFVLFFYPSCHSSTSADPLLPFWNSVHSFMVICQLMFKGSACLASLKKQIIIWLILNDSHEWMLFFFYSLCSRLLFMWCCFNFHLAFICTPVGQEMVVWMEVTLSVCKGINLGVLFSLKMSSKFSIKSSRGRTGSQVYVLTHSSLVWR